MACSATSATLIYSVATNSILPSSSLSKPSVSTITLHSSPFPVRAPTRSSLVSPPTSALKPFSPLVGNKAPDFVAQAVFDQEFINVKLSDYIGKKYVILFFYPLCPTEITAFSDRYAEFEKINTEILGVSIDGVFSQLAWVQTDRKSGGLGDLKYPLVYDVTKSISKSFGVLIPDQGIALRGLFIIDKEGVIQHSTINKLAIGRSVDETLRTLQALQYVQENPDEVCPAEWKPGEKSLHGKPPKSPEIPTIHTSTTPNSFQEKVLYLDSIGIDIFSLINHHRPIIYQSSINDIKSTINFLTSMNFTSSEFRRIISMCPKILTVNAATILPVFTFLLREVRVNGSDLKRVINRRPRLLISCVKNRLRPTLYFLQSIGIAEVNKHTYLLSCSVEDKLLPRIQCFEKLGFSYIDAVSMFRRFPQLFNYSVEDNIEPKFNYFVVEMGRELRELREFPQYFSFSLENRIKPRHQCCVEKGVCFNLKVLLKSSEVEFRQRLEICCGNSVPRRDSPLSSVYCDCTDQFDTQ